MSAYIHLNGRIVETTQAAIHPNDAGLLHGAGLFETMRAYNGRIFRLQAHLDRLPASAAKLGLPIGPEHLPSEADFQELLNQNGLRDARCRLTVTTGPMQMDAGESRPRPTVIVSATQMTAYPAQMYEMGMTVIIGPYEQSRTDPICGHKTINYFSRLLALSKARELQCGEALWFTPDKRLAEGSISNVFVARGGVLKTPPLDTPVLPGITRAAVIELATADHLSVSEAPLTINDLLDADEVFLTNAIMEVMPVTRVERKTIGSEKPGPVTRRLTELYREAVNRECAVS